jgi:hypothetical protein
MRRDSHVMSVNYSCVHVGEGGTAPLRPSHWAGLTTPQRGFPVPNFLLNLIPLALCFAILVYTQCVSSGSPISDTSALGIGNSSQFRSTELSRGLNMFH